MVGADVAAALQADSARGIAARATRILDREGLVVNSISNCRGGLGSDATATLFLFLLRNGRAGSHAGGPTNQQSGSLALRINVPAPPGVKTMAAFC
jgi:hypothetical protein